MTANKKIFVLGIDGGSWDIIKHWVKSGELATFKKLMSEGSWGDMESTFPPVTSPAWLSMCTGKNPGKIGVFEFENKLPNSYKTYIPNSTTIEDKYLWDILSENGKKSIIFNIPLTYPPQKINGIWVAGSPGKDSNYAYPKDIEKELKKFDYKVERMEPRDKFKKRKKYLKIKKSRLLKRIDAAKHLMESKDWDMFFFTTRETDDVQHAAWDLINEILEFYKILDDFLKYVSTYENISIFIVSDHGFGELKYDFRVNSWLADNGYLKLKKSKKNEFHRHKIRAILEKFRLDWIIKFLPEFIKQLPEVKGTSYNENEIDWSKTKAFVVFGYGIFINLKDRELMGIVTKKEYNTLVDEIIKKLKEIKMPNGQKLKPKIYKRDEIYHGEKTNLGPDIIWDCSHNAVQVRSSYCGEIFSEGTALAATHRMNGIFLAWGEGIKKMKINSNILDFLPTILAYLDIRIPRDVDGKTLNIFEKRKKTKYIQTKKKKIEKYSWNSKDTEKIKERLKALGYIE
jgi:predicted AlkP superfamily phosphohydrolase/phosphomutase